MYSVKMQVTAYGRQTAPARGVVRSCDQLQIFGGSNHITGTAEPSHKIFNFVHRWAVFNSSNRMISPTKGAAWLWSRDCFKILPFVMMQRVAQVCQRQLSYLF